jgi:hypothetical protein
MLENFTFACKLVFLNASRMDPKSISGHIFNIYLFHSATETVLAMEVCTMNLLQVSDEK